MPSAATFTVPPINELVTRYIEKSNMSVDPFAGNNSPAKITNDLSPASAAMFHSDALDFCNALKTAGCRPDLILFDPPYSYAQAVEMYKSVGLEWHIANHKQAGRWSAIKDILCEIATPTAVFISFGWNTTGFGKVRDCVPIEYLIVNHAGAHNDTLCTVETRVARPRP